MSSLVRTPFVRCTKTWLLATVHVSGRSTYVADPQSSWWIGLLTACLRSSVLLRSRRLRTSAAPTSGSSSSPTSSSLSLTASLRSARLSSRTAQQLSKRFTSYLALLWSLLVSVRENHAARRGVLHRYGGLVTYCQAPFCSPTYMRNHAMTHALVLAQQSTSLR